LSESLSLASSTLLVGFIHNEPLRVESPNLCIGISNALFRRDEEY
jgi:hypothetical protein